MILVLTKDILRKVIMIRFLLVSTGTLLIITKSILDTTKLKGNLLLI